MVDADPAVHELLYGVLQRDDRTIQAVSAAPQALDCLKQGPYDLVVADPGRNGWDGTKLLRRILALRPDTKVILTGDRDPVRAVAALRARAYTYFHKPLAP